MSQEERDWLEWLKRAQDGVVTQHYASEQMGITDRWVRRLLARMEDEGDGVVVHGLRGRASNRRIEEGVERRARLQRTVESQFQGLCPCDPGLKREALSTTVPGEGSQPISSEPAPSHRPWECTPGATPA